MTQEKNAGRQAPTKTQNRPETSVTPSKGEHIRTTWHDLYSERVPIAILLVMVVWISRYWYSFKFGLYEDDLTIIPKAVTMELPELLKYLGSFILHLEGHGRPLSDSSIMLFSHLGWKIAGMQGPYFIGYAIFLLNTALFYYLLRRIADASFAAIGALAYCLYCADTTQAYLTHSLGLQPSITFFLLATHASVSGRRFLPYILIFGSLLCYETVVPLFLAVPLLEKDWNAAWVRKSVRHVILLSGIVLTMVVLRTISGESRVSELTIFSAITTSTIHMVIGPIVALGAYIFRPLQALWFLNFEVAISIILSSFAFFVLLSRLPRHPAQNSSSTPFAPYAAKQKESTYFSTHGSWSTYLPNTRNPQTRLIIAGLVMLILAYPLTFTTRPYAISGRETRVHFAAVIGASILLAASIRWLYTRVRSAALERFLTAGLAVFFAMMVGYGFVIQADYVHAWDYQRNFWRSLLPKIQDIRDGTTILIDPVGLQKTREIGANTWNLPRILNQIYQFPPEWRNPPRVFLMELGWQDKLASSNGVLVLDATTTKAPPSLYRTIKSTDIILFETKDRELTRQDTAMKATGQNDPNKGTAEPVSNYQHGFLYDLIIHPTPK